MSLRMQELTDDLDFVVRMARDSAIHLSVIENIPTSSSSIYGWLLYDHSEFIKSLHH